MSSTISSIMKLPNELIEKICKIFYKKVYSETYPGNFSNHPDEFMQSEGELAYNVINNMDAWGIIKESENFMYNSNQTLIEIMMKIDQQSTSGHSGASIGFLMQHMRYIALHGWNKYHKKFIELS